MKTCNRCGVPRTLEEFYVDLSNPKDGRQRRCKPCVKAYNKSPLGKARMQKHRSSPAGHEAHRASCERWNRTPEAKKRKNDYARSPRGKLRASVTAKKRRREDPGFKLATNLRSRLASAIFRAGSAVRDLGCSVEELRVHLERQFKPGMTWENRGSGPGTWQLDHIRPLAGFDLADRGQLLQVCHFSNLQPLWFEEHVAKTAAEKLARTAEDRKAPKLRPEDLAC